MLTFELTASDLAQIRFAVSPISQLTGALIVLAGRALPAGMAEWRDATCDRFDELTRAQPLLASLVELLRVTRYVPDCVSPPPRRPESRIDDELEAIRATPADQVRADLRRSERLRRPGSSGGRTPQWDVPDLPGQLAAGLGAAWERLLADDWQVIRALLQRDIAYRAGIVATHGLAAAFEDLDDSLQWDASGRLALRGREPARHLPGGSGLWLVPNAFGGGWLCLDPPGAYALTYPARGSDALMQPRTPSPSDEALGRLIGRSRAALLLQLEQPATTTQLSAGLAMALGAVGDHLAVLRANELVTRSRAGRSVLYERTPAGDALVGRAGSGR